MKVKLARTESVEYDLSRELKRLRHCFKGETLGRQLLLIKYLLEGKIYELAELYDSLPYNEKNECPEKEYVGGWLRFLFNGDLFLMDEDSKYKESIEIGGDVGEELIDKKKALKSINQSLGQIKESIAIENQEKGLK